MSAPRDPQSAAEAPTLDAGAPNKVSGQTGDALPTESIESPGSAGARSTAQRCGGLIDQRDFAQVLSEAQAAAASPLATGRQLVNRFTITGVLGEGGMGTVYVARDAKLGRDVAIKVHHDASGAQRLHREAVAMAQLAHPNVVTVFEVGEVAGRPFVVMEYVAGTNLRSWLTAGKHSVRETLALLLAVGEGLAAAHEAGLVHRDIKPENVLIGADGRARIGDFGLARGLAGAERSPGNRAPARGSGISAARDPRNEIEGDRTKYGLPDSGEREPVRTRPIDELSTPVTQTGAVLGTPAYMAPEQFAGAPVDARADQFAFCVTVWEALWGERPFAGASYAQLHAAIALGTRRAQPASPKVPARIRQALDRGLAVEPAERFPTMHALLAAMRPTRGRRWGWLAAGGALALAGAATLVATRGPSASCESAGAAELAAVRSDLPALLRERGPARIASQAEAAATRYSDKFRGHARAACQAIASREWSPELAAKSQVCFAITARTAALSLAAADPARPMDALRRLRRLPPADLCRNPTHLASLPPPPKDAAQLAGLIEANAAVRNGFDAIAGHDFGQLHKALDAVRASPAHIDPGIAAGESVLRAWEAFDRGQVADARKLLIDAYYAARALDDDGTTSVALSVLIDRGTELGLQTTQAMDWVRTALADADRVRARSPQLAGHVYKVAARAYHSAGDADKALTYVARAREVLDRGEAAWIETFTIEGATRMSSGHVDDGVAAFESAIAQQIAYTSDDDPDVAELLSHYAASLLEVGRQDPALAAAERASKIIKNAPDPTDDRIDAVRVNLAAVLVDADRDDEALALLETARANDVRRLGEHNTIISNIDSNLAILYNDRHEYDRAIHALAGALATDEQLLGPDHVEVAGVAYNLAATHGFKHEYKDTIELARRAAAIYGARSPGSDHHRSALTMAAMAANETRQFAQALAFTDAALAFATPPQNPQTLAWSQLERARALIGLGRTPEARPLLAASRAAYAKLEMTQRVEQIDKLQSGDLSERPR